VSNIKDLKQHAHEVIKKNIDKAETIVQGFQSQWESQLGTIQNKQVEERIQRCKDQIESLKKQERNEMNMIKLLQEMNKLKALEDTLNQNPADRFDSSGFNENSPDIIGIDADEDQLANEDEILSDLENE
jgi:hypothetical protein